MVLLMAFVTWYCGQTASRWRKEAEEEYLRQAFAGD